MPIKLIISDFDGVLLDLKEIHFESLNKALKSISEQYVISLEDHIKTYDGLSTRKKLKILHESKSLPLDKFEEINNLKQKYTLELLDSFDNINNNIINIVKQLKQEGYLFYVASNAIRDTVEFGLKKIGIYDIVDKIYSNQDIKIPKPSSEIYLRCMIDAGVEPFETLIIEDSKHGRESAVKSGAYICGVDNSFDFTLDRIKTTIDNVITSPIKWAGRSDTIVLIPMAGAGKRFADAGYSMPKPLIDVNGRSMIHNVIDNLNIDAKYIFIAQKEHCEKYNLETFLQLISPGCTIIKADGLIGGAACHALLAKELINNDSHLIIANSDQIVDWDSCDFMYSMISSKVDGGILTFKANETKWSYAKCDDDGNVLEVAEKKVISDNATVGIYYWNKGSYFVNYAEQMISKNIRTNNEFYICPVYNEAILDNKKIKIKECNKMFGVGTPEDLKKFLNE